MKTPLWLRLLWLAVLSASSSSASSDLFSEWGWPAGRGAASRLRGQTSPVEQGRRRLAAELTVTGLPVYTGTAYFRIYNIQGNYDINLAEFQLFYKGVQLTGLTGTQSTVLAGFVNSNLFNGNLNDFMHTYDLPNNWVAVDITGRVFDTVVIWNRADGVRFRIVGATVGISPDATGSSVIWSSTQLFVNEQLKYTLSILKPDVTSTVPSYSGPAFFRMYNVLNRVDMNIAEVQLFYKGVQLTGLTGSQSSTLIDSPTFANANLFNGNLDDFAHTSDANPWMAVDITGRTFDTIVIWNRAGGNQERIVGATVGISPDAAGSSVIWSSTQLFVNQQSSYVLAVSLTGDPSLLMDFRFEQGDITGASLKNYALGGSAATLVGSPALTAGNPSGQGGSYLVLNAIAKYVTLPSLALAGADAFTFTAWLQIPSAIWPGTFRGIASFLTSTSWSSGVIISMSNQAAIYVTLDGSNGGAQYSYSIADKISSSSWFHLAVVMGNVPHPLLYINGVLVYTYPDGPKTTPRTYSSSFGNTPWMGGSENFLGNVDEIRLYKRQLLASEISQVMSLPTYTGPAFLRISNLINTRYLNLAEIQLFYKGVQLSGLSAVQSSNHGGGGYPASNLVDGNTATFAITDDANPWVVVDITGRAFDSVIIWNRWDGGANGDSVRIVGATIGIYSTSAGSGVIWSSTQLFLTNQQTYTLMTAKLPTLSAPAFFRMYSVLNGVDMNIAEVQLFNNGVQLTGLTGSQSATLIDSPSYANANLFNGNLNDFAHTQGSNPWMAVDISGRTFDTIVIWNRDGFMERIVGATVGISPDAAGSSVSWSSNQLFVKQQRTYTIAIVVPPAPPTPAPTAPTAAPTAPTPTPTVEPSAFPTSQPTLAPLVKYRTTTTYAQPGCVGPFLSIETTFLWPCIPAASGDGSYSVSGYLSATGLQATLTTQQYSDRACSVPADPPNIATDAIASNGKKCAAAASGTGSVATSYTFKRPQLPFTKGVLWSGYASAAACAGSQRNVYFNLTAAGTCLPGSGSSSLSLNCDQRNLYTQRFSDAACAVPLGPASSVPLASVKASGCGAATGGLFTWAACNFRGAAEAQAQGGMRAVLDPRLSVSASVGPSSSSSSAIEDIKNVPGSAQIAAALPQAPFFLVRTYYAGSRCAAPHASPALYFRLDPAPINQCVVPASGNAPFQFKCKLGAKRLSVVKFSYAVSDRSCAGVPVAQEQYLHEPECAQDETSRHYRLLTCGALPEPAASGAASPASLLVKEFSDPGCTNDEASRGLSLSTCGPVYGPARHGLTPVIEARRSVAFVSASQAGVVTVTESRFSKDDAACAGAAVQVTSVSFADGVCQADPLFPGSFVLRVARLPAGHIISPASPPPAWFASFPAAPTLRPTSAPTFTPAPSKMPTPAPSTPPTPGPTTVYVSRSLLLSLDASTFVSGDAAWVDSVGGLKFALYPPYQEPAVSNVGGGSIAFSAALGQYAQSNRPLPSLSAWTIETWVLYSSYTGQYPCIVTDVQGNNAQQGGAAVNFALGQVVSSFLSMGYYFSGGWRTSSPVTLPVGVWSHIVASSDGTTGVLHVNGVQKATANMVGTPASGNTGVRLMRRWDGEDYVTGQLAVVKMYGAALTAAEATQNFVLDKARFGYGPVLVLDAAQYSGQGDWIDTSASAFNFILKGSPAPAWSTAGGGSFSFVPSSLQAAITTNALPRLPVFSIELWFALTAVPSASAALFTEIFSAASGLGANFRVDSPAGDGRLAIRFSNSGWGTLSQAASTSAPLALNAWSHLACTYDGATLSVYLNGDPQGSVTVPAQSALPSSTLQGLALMTDTSGASGSAASYFPGRLAIVRVHNAPMPAVEVQASWNRDKARFGYVPSAAPTPSPTPSPSAPTPSPTPSPSALPSAPPSARPSAAPTVAGLVLSLDAAGGPDATGKWVDSVGGKSFTLYNAPQWDATVGGGSFRFASGMSQYGRTATSLPTMAAWSVETWFLHANSEPQACLVTDVVTNNLPLNYMFGAGGPYTTAFSFGFYAAQDPHFFYTPSYDLTAGLWYHLLGTFDGSAEKLYVNGQLASSTPQTAASTSGGGGIALMTDWGGGGGESKYFYGSLAVVRIYSRALSAAEASASYSRDQPRFRAPSPLPTPAPTSSPTRPGALSVDGMWFFFDASNPSSYPGTGSVLRDLVGSNDLTLYGTYSYDDGSLTNGIKAINFLGTGYSQSATFTPIPTVSERTTSMWLSMTDNTVTAWGFGLATSPSDNFEVINWNESGQGWCFGSSGFGKSGGCAGGGSAPNNQWIMITAVYSSAAYVMYQNGVAIKTFTSPGWLQSWTGSGTVITLGKRTSFQSCGGCSNPKARIGEASIWNRALAASEVASLFAATKAKYAVA